MADNVILISVQADDQASGPLNQIATGALRSVGAAIVEMAGGAVRALGDFGATSIKVAGDFEAGMNTFQAAAGDSLAAAGLSVDDFRDKFIQIGAELPVSTSAVQEAATTLIKGGLDPLVVKMGGLESSIKFAAAAGMDLNTAAELSIKQLGTFVPITASAAEQTAFLASSQDLLVKAAGASTLDVDKLGAAMLAAGGQARASGVDYQDFVSTMGLISPSFDSAATAGTSYKNFLARLQPTTKSATEAFERLHLITANGKSVFYDASGAFVGNRQAAELLKNALSGLSDAERSAALQAMFGNDAMGAAAALAANGAAGYDKFADAMAKASGVEATAATVQQGFNIGLDDCHGSIEALQIVVGTALLPALTLLFNGVLSPAINTVTTLAQALIGSSDAFARLPPVLQSVVIFFGDLWAAGMAIGTAFTTAGTYSLAFGSALDLLGAALGLPAGLLSGISFAIQDFIAWVAPAVGAIAAFAAGTGDLGTVADFLTDLFGVTIGTLLTDAIGVISNYAAVWISLGTTIANVAMALLSGDFVGAWAALTAGITQVIADYQVYAASLGQLIFNLGQTIANAVITYAPIIAAQVLTWGTAFISWITPYIPIALGYLAGFAASVWAWITAQAPILMAQIGTWGAAFTAWISPYIPIALGYLAGFAASVWGWITQQAPVLLQTAMSWGQALVDWIGPAIPSALGALGGLASSVFGWVSEQAAPLVASFTAWAAALIEWIPGATVEFLAAWPDMLSGFLDWIASAAGPILAGLAEWAIAFVGWVAPMIPVLVVALAGIALALGAFIVETVGTLIGKLLEWGPPFYNWIHETAIPGLLTALEAMGTRILEWIGSAAGWLGEQAASLGADIVSGIVKGVTGAAGRLFGALKDMAMGALGAAKDAIESHSPSRLFASEVGAPIVDGIVVGIANRSPKAVEAMLDLAGKLFDVVSKGVGAFSELRQLGSVPMSAITQFADAIQFTLEDFSRRVGIWDKAAMSAASQFTFKAGQVVDFLAKGLDLLTGISNLTAPSSAAITQFADALSWTITEIVRISTWELRLGLMAGVEFASGAGQIVGVIAKGVEALNSLSDFVRPAPGVISTFVNVLWWLVSRIVEVAGWMSAEAVGAAAAFADGAGKVLAIVGAGVDAFLKLGEFVRPPAGVTQQFADMIGWLVSRIVEVAGWIGRRGIEAAGAFAEGVGKVLAIVGAGVDAFLKLGEFVRPPAGVTQQFADMIGWLVSRIVEVAGWIGRRGIEAAGAFAEGVGKVLAIVGAGVDAFAKLGQIVAPAPESVAILKDGLVLVVGLLWFGAHTIAEEGLAAVVVFAEGAGKVVSIISNAVDAFAKLPNIIAPTPDAVFALKDGLVLVVGTLWFGAHTLAADGVAAVVVFAESAGKIVSVIGAAVDAFAKLPEIIAPGPAAVFALKDGLVLVVGTLWFAAHTIDTEALAAVVVFAESAGKVVAILDSAVKGFTALADLQPVADSAIQLFVALVNRLMVDLAAAASGFSAEAVAAAGKFAQAAGAAVGILEKGVTGLLNVDTFAGVSEAAINRFADGVRLAVAAMVRLAAEFGPDATAAAKAFAQAAGESTDFLKKGADGFKKVSEFTEVPVAGLRIFADGVRQMVATVLQLSTVIDAQMLADATRFAIGVDQVIEVVKGGLKAFADLAGMAGNTQPFLAKFMEAVGKLAADFKSAAIPAAADLGTSISTAIATGIGNGGTAITAALMLVAQRIALFFTNVLPQLATAALSIGQQIGLGFANGLISTIPLIVQAAVAAAYAAIIAARQALGIASPSKVFGQIGSFAGQGLTGGMQAEQTNVAAAGAGLAQSASLGAVSGLPTPSGASQAPTTSNHSVTLQVATGAVVVNAAPGQSEEQIANDALSRLQELTRMAAPA